MPTDDQSSQDVTLCFEPATFQKIAAAFFDAVRVESEKEGCPPGWIRVRLDPGPAGVLFSALVARLDRAGRPADGGSEATRASGPRMNPGPGKGASDELG